MIDYNMEFRRLGDNSCDYYHYINLSIIFAIFLPSSISSTSFSW